MGGDHLFFLWDLKTKQWGYLPYSTQSTKHLCLLNLITFIMVMVKFPLHIR